LDGFGTLLIITEANYMRFNEFKKGQIVKWKDEIGEVNFIDKMYITITLRRWKKPPELAEHSCYPYGEVNLLCNNKYWDELELQNNTEEQQSSSAMYKSQEGRYIDP
tara:strand:- start:725 stop:1045 length:321 start_codon:yes stop_codon:yes gene_type:complete